MVYELSNLSKPSSFNMEHICPHLEIYIEAVLSHRYENFTFLEEDSPELQILKIIKLTQLSWTARTFLSDFKDRTLRNDPDE